MAILIFIQNFVCVLTNKIENIFSFCCQDHTPGVGLGVLRGSKTLAWGFAMVPHRLRILVSFGVNFFPFGQIVFYNITNSEPG